MLAPLTADVTSLLSTLKRTKAVNVNDQSSKDRAIALATQYFNDVRPTLVAQLGESEKLLQHDGDWQKLLRLAQGNNRRSAYTLTLSSIRRQLSDFSVQALSRPANLSTLSTSAFRLSREEELLVTTLEKIVPSAAASYRQGLIDLNEKDRMSYRGTATEFREALRETLDHLAPDDEVESQNWYKPEDKQDKPTMKQKVRYVLLSRSRNRTQRDAAEKALSLIDQFAGEVARAVYNRASLATHVHQAKQEVQRIKRYVDTVLFDLLEVGS